MTNGAAIRKIKTEDKQATRHEMTYKKAARLTSCDFCCSRCCLTRVRLEYACILQIVHAIEIIR